MKEVWKDIKDFNNLYSVSNLGHVKSIKTSKQLKAIRSSTGYYHVSLYKDHKYSTCNIHRLVAQAFIPNPDNKSQVNHIDGNKSNNRASNLEWVSRSENQLHAIKHHLRKPSPMTGRKGGSHPRSKPILQYSITGKFIKKWESITEAAEELNCYTSSISSALTGVYKTGHGYIWKYAP